MSKRIFLTGGSGRLGTELRRLLPSIIAPSSQDCDISDSDSLHQAISQSQAEIIVHAAAYTNVAAAEEERERCWQLNVTGSHNIVQTALEHKLPVVYISTDYVFWGDRGHYSESDVPGPVRNFYALSKLVAEELMRLLPEYLIIRTSFRPRDWPYDTAFADVYTSQDYVDIIAEDIALAISNLESLNCNTLHIATERKSVYELARRRKPDVKHGSKASVMVNLPDDISLDISRWQALKRSLLPTAHDL